MMRRYEEEKKITPYDDLWNLDEREEETDSNQKRKKFPPQPEKDLLLFIEEYSREARRVAA